MKQSNNRALRVFRLPVSRLSASDEIYLSTDRILALPGGSLEFLYTGAGKIVLNPKVDLTCWEETDEAVPEILYADFVDVLELESHPRYYAYPISIRPDSLRDALGKELPTSTQILFSIYRKSTFSAVLSREEYQAVYDALIGSPYSLPEKFSPYVFARRVGPTDIEITTTNAKDYLDNLIVTNYF